MELNRHLWEELSRQRKRPEETPCGRSRPGKSEQQQGGRSGGSEREGNGRAEVREDHVLGVRAGLGAVGPCQTLSLTLRHLGGAVTEC